MRVVFDPQTFLRQRTGGISRLFSDLIGGFDTHKGLGVEAVTPFTWVNNEYVVAGLSERRFRRPPAWVPREVLYAPWMLRGLQVPEGIDLVHHTYYDRRFLGDIGVAMRVSTIHDMIPEKFAGTSQFTGSHLAKADYVRRSDLLICVSKATHADLEYYLGTPPGDVVVVPNAVQPGFRPDLPRVSRLPAEYILYVGKRGGYKDFRLLPSAIAQLKSRSFACNVVVVGPSFDRAETEAMVRLGVRDLFHHHVLDEAQLRSAYSNSLLVVQTSMYEGFGMTPLEGMASRVPVVVANSSSMPEVGGDVARYFEPSDAESLAEQVESLLASDTLRAELGRRGLARAELFSARRMAERTAQAYRSVLGSS